MKTIVDKNLGTLVHIYDYLNGGYFVAHHQLQYYNEQAYQLYLNKDKEKLLKLYNNLKSGIPNSIISIIENSPSIRYFCCDGCHDAKITNAYIENNYLVIELNTDGMLGCLNVHKSCFVKIKSNTELSCHELINDVKLFKQMYWLYSDISFDDDIVNFALEVQVFIDTSYENIKYEFSITDIVVE